MIKKKYVKPTMQIEQEDIQFQILAGSLQGVSATGLGEDIFEYDDSGDNPVDAL